MKKRNFWTASILVLLTLLFDVVAFWFIDDYTSSFWTSVVFGNAAILVFAIASFASYKKGKYVYLDYQNDMVIGGYYIICEILNICFILFKMQNTKVNLFVNIILLIIYLIVLFIFLAANAGTTAQLENDKQERNTFYSIKDRAELLLDKGKSREINKKIESLYDRVCSCQINRTVNVSEIEKKIIDGIDGLSEIVSNANYDMIAEKVAVIISLIDDRDRIIRNSLKR